MPQRTQDLPNIPFLTKPAVIFTNDLSNFEPLVPSTIQPSTTNDVMMDFEPMSTQVPAHFFDGGTTHGGHIQPSNHSTVSSISSNKDWHCAIPTTEDLLPEIDNFHTKVSNDEPSLQMNELDVTSNLPLSNPTPYMNSDGITFDEEDYAALASLLKINQLEKGLQTDPIVSNEKSTQTVIDSNFFVLMEQFFNSTPLSQTETHRFHTTATQDGRVHEININLNLNQS